jgi:hypothetical protein
MAWFIRTTELPPSWPHRCVGCGSDEPSGRIKIFGERLEASIGVAHMFERFCLQLPWCEACAGRMKAALLVGLGLLVVPWLLITVLSFEPSLKHLVSPRLLVSVAFGLNGLGLLALGLRYVLGRPVRLLVGREGVRGIALRNAAVAAELAEHSGQRAERSWRPRGW